MPRPQTLAPALGEFTASYRRMTRQMDILAFAAHHGASPDWNDWDDTLKMLFAIQHPKISFR